MRYSSRWRWRPCSRSKASTVSILPKVRNRRWSAPCAAPPDLITADYRIVGGTGIEAVAAIEARLGPIPVVYVTGNADLIEGRSKMVVDKPISPKRLAEACALATRALI